ncbi:MAG: peptide chain release factor N(5)-glutamine methyltransferase [Chloroflexota bacterium]
MRNRPTTERRSAVEHPVTPADALRFGQSMCAQAGSDTPRLDAEVLLRHVLGIGRAELFARLNDPLDPGQASDFFTLLGRRVAGEPVAYLTGEREFFGRPFRVGEGVLVPRPETELLVEWALGWLRGHPGASVIDVGTGSGAIALTLAAELGEAWSGRIVGVDFSVDALAWARRNRAALGLDRRVKLIHGDLLDWASDRSAGLVVANLPYLTPAQLDSNSWLAAEPASALVAGDDGLDLVRCAIAALPRVLQPGGAAGFEIDPAQAAEVRRLLSAALPGAAVRTIPDLAGLPRHFVAET